MKKVCVITATRAEYGSLKCLLDALKNDSYFELQIISTGSHLSPEYGMTNNQIIDDGFIINKKVEILLSSDSPIGVSKSMGLALISFAEAFDELNPDLIILQGDRYELLPIASAACVAQIPIAHFSGGEITEGAIDDVIRHAITKLSHIHFTTIQEYSQRVIQMGENRNTVFTVGEIGLDNLNNMQLLSQDDFESSIGHKLKKRNLLFTYHPVTTQDIPSLQKDLDEILQALSELQDTFIIFTKANTDVGGRFINSKLDEYVEKHAENTIIFDSLGQLRYLSSLQYVDAIVGNSSSGLTEAPSFKLATINIGDRQKGRVRTSSVIDVPAQSKAILTAINSIYTDEFKKLLSQTINPYGEGNSSQKVISILKKINFSDLVPKKFIDINIKN